MTAFDFTPSEEIQPIPLWRIRIEAAYSSHQRCCPYVVIIQECPRVSCRLWGQAQSATDPGTPLYSFFFNLKRCCLFWALSPTVFPHCPLCVQHLALQGAQRLGYSCSDRSWLLTCSVRNEVSEFIKSDDFRRKGSVGSSRNSTQISTLSCRFSACRGQDLSHAPLYTQSSSVGATSSAQGSQARQASHHGHHVDPAQRG